MILDYINCLIEITIYFLLNSLFIAESFRWKKLWFVIPCTCVISLYFVFVTPQVLAINCIIYIGLALLTFGTRPFLRNVFIASISTMLIITLQFVFYGFLPIALLQTDIGNLAGNLILLIFVSILLLFVRKYQYYYLLSDFALRFKYQLLLIWVLSVTLGQFYLSRLTQLWDALPGLISLLLLILFVLLFFKYVSNQKLRDGQRQLLYEQNLRNSQALMDTIRVQVHDFKHHIHHLHNLIDSTTDLASLKTQSQEYISLLEQDRSLYDLVLSIENPGIRAFLFGCCDSCRKNHIQLDIQATPVLPSFPLKEYQLIEILENLMTNAIEHNLLLNENSRFIHIQLQHENGENAFSIENPIGNISLPVEEMFIMNQTSKGGPHQGLGLSSISNILNNTPVRLSAYRDQSNQTIVFSLLYSDEVS